MTADFSTHPGLKKKWMLTGIAAILIIVLVIPLACLKFWQRIDQQSGPWGQGVENTSVFVGKEKCMDCHRNEYEKWRNSDHDRAMEKADNSTVLGDFNDAEFIHNQIITRFFKKGDQFFCQYHWSGRYI